MGYQDVNRIIDGRGIKKEDNIDVWSSLEQCINKGAAEGTLRVTWCKGHAKDEHITAGQAIEEERHGNMEADKLATAGILLNAKRNVLIKTIRQKRTIAILHQARDKLG